MPDAHRWIRQAYTKFKMDSTGPYSRWKTRLRVCEGLYLQLSNSEFSDGIRHLGCVVSSVLSEERRIVASLALQFTNQATRLRGGFFRKELRDVKVSPFKKNLTTHREKGSLLFLPEYEAVLVRTVSNPGVVNSKRKQPFIIMQPDPFILWDPRFGQSCQRVKRERVEPTL